MALMALPNELLDVIVEYSLSWSFENLATTCKRIYALCTPFIKRHNELRSRFRHFGYYAHARDSLVAASDLISLIAADPIVARYIRTANLVEDSKFLPHLRVREPPKSVPSIEDGGVIVQLFANSTYLRRARLDWRKYYSTFAEDVREMRYSQHGSAFLLTLLGDAENLTIPNSWKPNAATTRLLHVLIKEAKQPSFLSSSSALRPVTNFRGSLSRTGTENVGLSWAHPFLALPHLTSFSGPGFFATGENPRSLAFGGSPYVADRLEAAHLSCCCIDDVGITDFLKHTPRLKTLSYSHSTKHVDRPPDWDICKFINTVAREAGSHLIELEVAICKLRGSILPGKASTRGFQKLQKFEFPQELVMCNFNAAGVTGNIATSLQRLFNGSLDPFVRDLIPTSVTHLALMSNGMGPYDKALDALFRHFRAVRRSQLPDLQHVWINLQQEADNVYKQQCNKIVAECDREGVVVHLRNRGLTWDW
ncbi:hypothetical protein BU26DRAFT_172519 [Trematosphaeria pertusa]|uniref:F-box domain-containing protein n=1 Tax=Trematosphaeria pertusa TaxID=390896 RepID=A0A6A6HTL1_9PLEO|nr:uncharacterized protein BU26DRAFT_172519 [Trematosphaeria pertusa]KAF2241524.1 hypothetical protein BU26DRAFT_172519 [Trematosphaeria pertusa]